jgi:hypothetical protein
MIEMVEGVPFVWPEPNLGKERRKYTIMGKEKLNDPEWEDFTPEEKIPEGIRFFKVKVGKW